MSSGVVHKTINFLPIEPRLRHIWIKIATGKHNAAGCEQPIVGLNSDSLEGSPRPSMVKDIMAKVIHHNARTTTVP